MSKHPEQQGRNANGSFALRLQQLTGQPVTSRRRSGASVLLLDTSESMEGGRLDEAKRGGMDFAASMRDKGVRVGIVAFNKEASIVLSDARSSSDTAAAIGRLSASGTTHVAKALRAAQGLLLAHDTPDRSVCIVSDGQPSDRDKALEVAGEMKRAGIQILTIAVADADREFLGEFASKPSLALATGDSGLRKTLTGAAWLLLEGGSTER